MTSSNASIMFSSIPKSTIKARAKDWLPPALWRGLRKWRGHRSAFQGNYASWMEARKDSTGYESAEIASRVLAATLKVLAGEASFERDSLLFNKPSPRYPLVAELLATAGTLGNRLSVMDFGGSLGSLYHQHRCYLKTIENLTWGIVEQKAFVDAGRMHLSDTKLQFFDSIERCVKSIRPDITVASCALQYLADPRLVLQMLLPASATLIIDRLPLIDGETDRLTVQTVGDEIYAASYPAWFFSRHRFEGLLDDFGYRVVNEFESIDTIELDHLLVRTIGLVIRRKGAL